MMYRHIKSKLSSFILLFLCCANCFGQTDESAIAAKLWEGLGGKENWQTARYFMFSCIGGAQPSLAQGERKYLWDKHTGDCRFEGITSDDETLIVLFNIKTGKGTVYINTDEIDNQRIAAGIIEDVIDEFERDAQLLFLPTVLEGDHATYTIEEEKLVGTQRFTIVNIKNKKTSFEATIDGKLYLDTQTGQVLEWSPNQMTTHFSISGFKDIGGGLVMPTHFTGIDTSVSVRYPLAAALVNIEAQKFKKP